MILNTTSIYFGLMLIAGLAMAQLPRCQPSGPVGQRTQRRLAAERMFKKCFGDARFTERKTKMSAILDGCRQKKSEEYLKNNVVTIADILPSGNKTADERVLRNFQNHLGNYTCALTALEFIEPTLSLKTEKVRHYFGGLGADREMRELFEADVNDCSELAKGTSASLITRALKLYKNVVKEPYVRLGIFLHCMRGRITMVCQSRDPEIRLSPLMALSFARVPILDNVDRAFDDMFSLMEDHPLWVSYSP